MRKKNVLSKDKKKRAIVLKSEMSRLLLKTIFTHKGGFLKYNVIAKYLLQTQIKNTSYVRLKNYCLITGRNKGVFRKFRLSRIKIRELLADGLLINYSKVT